MQKKILIPLGAAVLVSSATFAQVAGKTTLGVSVVETDAVLNGWSAKKAILDKNVYNDEKKKVGKVEDIIVTPDNSVSFAILGVGGFVGVGKHDVAIPITQLKSDGDNFVLPGATKEALKALPEFEYAKKK